MYIYKDVCTAKTLATAVQCVYNEGMTESMYTQIHRDVKLTQEESCKMKGRVRNEMLQSYKNRDL